MYTDKSRQRPAAVSTQLNKIRAADSVNKAHVHRRNPGLRSMKFPAIAGLHTGRKQIPSGSGQDQGLHCEISACRQIVSPVQPRSEKFARDPDADIRSAKAQSGRGIRRKLALMDFSVVAGAIAHPCQVR